MAHCEKCTAQLMLPKVIQFLEDLPKYKPEYGFRPVPGILLSYFWPEYIGGYVTSKRMVLIQSNRVAGEETDIPEDQLMCAVYVDLDDEEKTLESIELALTRRSNRIGWTGYNPNGGAYPMPYAG